jgi:hypothetical protein
VTRTGEPRRGRALQGQWYGRVSIAADHGQHRLTARILLGSTRPAVPAAGRCRSGWARPVAPTRPDNAGQVRSASADVGFTAAQVPVLGDTAVAKRDPQHVCSRIDRVSVRFVADLHGLQMGLHCLDGASQQ